MTTMPHLPLMAWDFKDQLQETQTRVDNTSPVETTYYVYDSGGQRVRKVNATAGGAIADERIYLGGFELYREYSAGASAPTLERQTLHVMDGKRRIAMVETLTKGDDGSAAQLVRYQLANHLGSSNLELDGTAKIISYEEYYPYGSTSYQAVDASIKAAAKRYRHTGKERDEETGLNYHGARYFASWLARWTSCDPVGLTEGINFYVYVGNCPINFFDPNGCQHVHIGDDPTVKAAAQDLHQARPDLAKPTPSSTPTRNVSGPQARAEANVGAAAVRRAQGMTDPAVQAGHTQAARHTSESGAPRSQVNDPATFQQLHSRRGQGLDVTKTDPKSGVSRTTTRHRAQEGMIDDAVESARAGGRLTPEGQAAAGNDVLWRTQGTGMDQREVSARRASGAFDEAAAIERSPAVQAQRAATSARVSQQPPRSLLTDTEGSANLRGLKTGGAVAGALAVAGAGVLAYDLYKAKPGERVGVAKDAVMGAVLTAPLAAAAPEALAVLGAAAIPFRVTGILYMQENVVPPAAQRAIGQTVAKNALGVSAGEFDILEHFEFSIPKVGSWRPFAPSR